MSERTPLRTLDIYIAVLFVATVVTGGLGLSGFMTALLIPTAGTALLAALLSVTLRWVAVIIRGDAPRN